MKKMWNGIPRRGNSLCKGLGAMSLSGVLGEQHVFLENRGLLGGSCRHGLGAGGPWMPLSWRVE